MKNLRRLFIYIKKYPFYLILSLICALIYVLSMVLMPLINGFIIDQITLCVTEKINLIATEFYKFLLIDCMLIVLILVFQYLFEILTGMFVERISKDLKDDLFIKINKVKIEYIDTHAHGDLVSRLINDTENVNNALISSFRQLYQGSIQILATLVIMFIFNWILALIVVFLAPIGFFISYYVARHTNKYFKAQSKIVGELGSIVLEDFNNIDVIKSFNYEDESFEKYSKTNKELYGIGRKAQFMSSLTNPIIRLINYSIYAIVGMSAALLCALSFKENNVMLGASCTVGTILTFMQYSNQFAKPFNEISACVNEVQTGLSSLRRINEVLDECDDIDEGQIDFSDEVENIIFDKVYFNYSNKQKLIENFNLNVSKGERVAIVGPTGCGKTTMINLLLRFYDSKEGDIKINNISTKMITKKSLRNKIGMVLQDTWIFHGTVLENIKYARPDATFEEVCKAAERANALNFINHLPKGFDTKISDSSGLSVGEKQLICIARVLLLEPEIMILDEATSNIDTRCEMKISKAFNEMMKGKTSFVIAHRLSTIVNSDLIIVMNEGQIVEVGKHADLLNKKSFYYKIYNAQHFKKA